MRRLTLAITILATLAVSGPAAQDASAPPSQAVDTVYASRATAILVDVVVRDKKGRPVTDLETGDFTVFEDGVRQEIGSFSVVNRGDGIGIGVKVREPGRTTIVDSSPAPDGTLPDAPELPPATALIFDGLSADALNLSRRAALDYIPANGEAPGRIAVFATVPSMQVLQGYTSDVGLIRNAIRQVTAAGTAAADVKEDRLTALNRDIDQLRDQSLRVGGQLTSGTAGLAGAGGGMGQLEADLRLAEGNKSLIEAFDAMDRDHRGYGAASTLMAVLKTLSLEAGRKTVVLFSEGLPASPVLRERLQQIIEFANRFNVTVYAVDAIGLRATSALEDTRREVVTTGNDRLRQASLGVDAQNGPFTRMVERTEDLLRLDSQGGLARLAEDTGGFLVRDTNDIGKAFERIDEDMRFHYLLTYSPTNETLDGKFRTIDVNVDRPGTKVFARKGYRAVPSSLAPSIPDYEAPALALLDSGSLPNAFPVRAGGLVFPNEDGAIVPVIVKVDTSTLRFEVDEAKGTYSGQVAIVARIKDQSGQVLQKASQQYVLTGEAKDVGAAGTGEILFYREPRLAPGLYEVESIVYDMVSRRASARVSTLTVPEADRQELQMSSVVIVSKTERVEGSDEQTEAPLYYGDVLLYPNLGDPVSRSGDGEVAFYFSLYPALGRGVTEAKLELLRNGRPVAVAPLEVSSPRAEGEQRLQHVGRLPLAQVPPGTYELRIQVSDGKTARSGSAFFTVEA